MLKDIPLDLGAFLHVGDLVKIGDRPRTVMIYRGEFRRNVPKAFDDQFVAEVRLELLDEGAKSAGIILQTVINFMRFFPLRRSGCDNSR